MEDRQRKKSQWQTFNSVITHWLLKWVRYLSYKNLKSFHLLCNMSCNSNSCNLSGDAWLLFFPCPYILLPDIYAIWVRSHESVEFHVEIFNTQQVYIVFSGYFSKYWRYSLLTLAIWSILIAATYVQLEHATGKNFTLLHSNKTKSAFPNSISAYLANCGENTANTVTTAEVFLLYMYVQMPTFLLGIHTSLNHCNLFYILRLFLAFID